MSGMAADFTQDAVLRFLQSSGGSVKNSDLLLHFKNFIREHPDRDRNRELFKRFVNSVATVQQLDGVSHVVLRRKFRGHVTGGGERGSPGALRTPAAKSTEPSVETAEQSPARRAEKPRPRTHLGAVTAAAAAAPGAPAVLPAAGIIVNNNNNNKVERKLNLNLQLVSNTPEESLRPPAAQVVSQVKSPSPAQDQFSKVGPQRRGLLAPPLVVTPVVAAVRSNGDPCEPVPEPPRGRQPEGGLHVECPPHPQVSPRRIRHRQSYKSAMSYDEDEEEEEEPRVMRSPAGGAWPVSAPLHNTGRALAAASPCIIDVPVVSSSSERKLPKIYIHGVTEELLPAGGPDGGMESGLGKNGQWAGPGSEPGSVPGASALTRRSLPVEPERYVLPADGAEALHHVAHRDSSCMQPTGVQLEPRRAAGQGQRAPGQGQQAPGHGQREPGHGHWAPGHSQWAPLSSSHSSIFTPSPEAGISSRGSQWNRSYEDLPTRTAGKVQEVLQQAQRTKCDPVTHRADSKTLTPWHHSSDNLRVDQERTAHLLPWHRSTGELYNDHEEVGSSDGSTFTPPLRQRPPVVRRLSSQQRSRMCRSLGADLDLLLQEEARGGGGNEAARLNRLHLISSSLSLCHGLSSSSLSSCSTPPRCQSLGDLAEGGMGDGKSLPVASSSAAHHEDPSKQSLIPLEPREHAWLVKGAAGAWPDIYSLFREDASLLNRRDFISGFTVLHWIAKHGDHRVLNTLWYGVQKVGLVFDINARSTSGHTPLHIAAIHGHKNIIRLLVSKFSADVTLRDTAGKKAWQYLSCAAPPDVFQLLGAPQQAAERGEGRVERVDKDHQPQRRRRRHHFSSASSGKRPPTVSGTAKVKRSSSLAAFLKHKSLHRFHGHQSDSSI